MNNETKTFNITTVKTGQRVVEVETGTVMIISDVTKRGRWHYIELDGGVEELSEGKFFDRFAEVKPVKVPKTNSPLRKVKAVSGPALEDAMTAGDIEEGREALTDGSVRGLVGFDKFRAIHKAETVVVSTGSKVRTQSVRDDIANSLLDGIEEYGSIWLIPMVANNLPVAQLQVRYANLNPGMVRMNVGNMLRAKFRKAASTCREAASDLKVHQN